ncbi:MAG: hypothetical protein GF375_05945 [Candidatus Omnitrophica bacterium]|nr:hypothetical protein [Candidatus Omnitrophota bacterium]MBD3269517.1 hypothetical protein [Candidatus Omnitrophota bacterium]
MCFNKFSFLTISITSILILLIFAGWYFLFTAAGSKLIARAVISEYTESESVKIAELEGNLARKLIIEGVEIEDLRFLPSGSKLMVQKLEVCLWPVDPERPNIKIHNGRLKFPGAGLIVFYGDYKDSSFGLNVYSKNLNIRDMLDLFAKSEYLKKISGTAEHLDVYIRGTFLEPRLKGTLYIEKLIRNGFSMSDCSIIFDLQLKDMKEKLKIYGEILLESGILSGPKTALVNLEPSRVLFFGDTRHPSFDLKGHSKVDGVRIDIKLKGIPDEAGLKLSSQPPLAQERLLVMLATNRKWKGAESSISQGAISADLASDFIDYFVFDGTGNKMKEKLGISEFLLKFDKQGQGVKVKKSVNEKTDVSYGVEQTGVQGKGTAISHKVGTEYKITDTVSVGAEKEIKQEAKDTQTGEKQKTEDKVILKYKKEF